MTCNCVGFCSIILINTVCMCTRVLLYYFDLLGTLCEKWSTAYLFSRNMFK